MKTQLVVKNYCKKYSCEECPLRITETIQDKLPMDNAFRYEKCYINARESMKGYYYVMYYADRTINSLKHDLKQLEKALKIYEKEN